MRSKNDYWDYLMHYNPNHDALGRFSSGNGVAISSLKGSRNKNLDSWGKSPSTNVLYITGQSGSGKSYIADKIANSRTKVIHLDTYFDYPLGKRCRSFDKFLEKDLPEYKRLSASTTDISFDEWKTIANKFEKSVERYGEYEYSKKNKVICEGVHLLDPDDLWADKSFFSDKPVAVLKTNSIKSNYRAIKRDNVFLTPTEVYNRTSNTIEWNKEIRNFTKNANIS